MIPDSDLIALHRRLWEQDDDPEYDARANSYGCWLLAIEEMRKEILKEREAGR